MRSLLKRLGFFSNKASLGDTKMVILVRTDIAMGKGKVATQCAHAAVSLYRTASETAQPELKSWIYSGQPKIILRISENCEETMTKMYIKAKEQGLNTCLIYDAGKTQVKEGTLTAVGIGPNSTKDIDNITNHFNLL